MNTNIITLMGNEARVSHRVIALNVERKEISIRKVIDKYVNDFKEFGQLSFKMTPTINSVKAVNNEKTYFLNEQQATLLFTYLRNNEIVRAFKIQLVKAFYKMKEELYQKQINKNNPYIYQLERENIELRRTINRLSLQPTQSDETKKLQSENRSLKQALIDFSNRYNSIVLKADNTIEVMRDELRKMTNRFQTLPNLANDGKNLNTETQARHNYW